MARHQAIATSILALMISVSGAALAQGTSSSTSNTMPAQPSSHPAYSGSSTAKPMTEAQIKKKLSSQGYTDIKLTQNSDESLWSGTAKKHGKTVNVGISQSGRMVGVSQDKRLTQKPGE